MKGSFATMSDVKYITLIHHFKHRRNDKVWEQVRFKSDMALYFLCGCGFRYAAYTGTDFTFDANSPDASDKLRTFAYCPFCGASKTRISSNVRRIDKFSFEK